MQMSCSYKVHLISVLRLIAHCNQKPRNNKQIRMGFAEMADFSRNFGVLVRVQGPVSRLHSLHVFLSPSFCLQLFPEL